MTQLESAKKGIATRLIRQIARFEGLPVTQLLQYIKDGRVVIPNNSRHKIKKPCGVGFRLKTKINANIGTSTDRPNLKEELKKLDTAVRYGADAVMDLSVGGDLRKIRRQVLRRSQVPIGTVPIYEIAVSAHKKHKDFLKFNIEDILSVLEAQAKEGVDFFTIHSGVTRKSIEAMKNNPRVMGIVSRGGAMIAAWMKRHRRENPFFEYFDAILDIAYTYDVTLSLGDGLRPGSVLDATDEAQITELKILGELARRSRKRNVQVMIEGPGHVPLDQIQKNILLEKKFCDGAPFYVLGPLVTDVAPGYDHITSSIGGALAASFGADFLCYVTPSEHLRHPSNEDVREGVVASRIAAHAADIVKGVKGAIDWDRQMSQARRKRDWNKQIKLSIDPDKARSYRLSSKPQDADVCTMCGKYCSIKLSEECISR
ncbi:MAG: phosphomethylpyrimidine synthase ThiC [Candidatus Omnitrophica bacterium]|nr:phosphomethylpyrimidine synthase ThiC [Candidatus Omnitrophota bacterium]